MSSSVLPRNEPSFSSSSLPYLASILNGKHPLSIPTSKRHSAMLSAVNKADRRRLGVKSGKRL